MSLFGFGDLLAHPGRATEPGQLVPQGLRHAQGHGHGALATQPPAPVQQTEAVAWQVRQSKAASWGPATTKRIADHWEAHGYEVRALYATPPAPALPPVARVPLTDPQLDAMWTKHCKENSVGGLTVVKPAAFARAVLAAHGIEASTGEQS